MRSRCDSWCSYLPVVLDLLNGEMKIEIWHSTQTARHNVVFAKDKLPCYLAHQRCYAMMSGQLSRALTVHHMDCGANGSCSSAAAKCVCVLQLFVCVGILLAFVIGLPYDGKEATVHLLGNDTAWWRVMFGLGLVPSIMQVCCLMHLPP